jgi:GNAT superfamily N-acetyltransferase
MSSYSAAIARRGVGKSLREPAALGRRPDEAAVTHEQVTERQDEEEDAGEDPDVGEVERDNAAIPDDHQRVRHFHSVPGSGDAVPEQAAGEDPSSECDEERSDADDQDQPDKQREREQQPCERPLVIGPRLGSLARLHEQIGACERKRNTEHDPDPTHDHDGTGAETLTEGRIKGRIEVMRVLLADGFVLDDDPDRIDRAAVHAFIRDSYWATGRDRALMDDLIVRSARVVGLYDSAGGQQGFARVVSDGHTVSYLADVYVLEEIRGRGFGLELVRFTVDGGSLGQTHWLLRTQDMHRLYAKLGFVAPGERTMERCRRSDG